MKLIVSDLDGTLLNEKKEITERTKKIIREAYSKGIDFAIASGRSQHSIKKFQQDLGIKIFSICNNGANVYDKDENLIYSNPMKSEVVKKVITFLRENKVNYNGFSHRNLYLDDKEKNPVLTVESGIFDIIELGNGDNFPEMFKIIARQDEEALRKLKDFVLQQEFAPEIDVTITQPNCMDIVDKNCSKGNAIEFISKQFNIPIDEIIAFGDGENDYSMLAAAGHPVVMENGMATLKEAFSTRALTNEEEGVAIYLENILNLK